MLHNTFYDIVKIENDKVFIIDLDLPGSRSVTNDAENVYVEIKNLFPYKRVIYRDTMGQWDEITKNDISLQDSNIEFIPYKGCVPKI